MGKNDLTEKTDGGKGGGPEVEKRISPLVAAAISEALSEHLSDDGSLCSEDYAVAS